MVDSLKALDPTRPIREADIVALPIDVRFTPSSPSFDHHATTEEHDMRQLGKWRNRNLALGTLMVTGSGAKALVGSRLAQRSPLAPP